MTFHPRPLWNIDRKEKIMEIQEDYRERKNIQPDLKHMPKSIKPSHNHLDRILHFFGGHGVVGNEERKIFIIVLPPNTLSGKESVLFLEPLGQLCTGYGDWQQNLDRVYLGLFDESPKMSYPFLGRYPDQHIFLKRIPKNEHSMDQKSTLIILPR